MTNAVTDRVTLLVAAASESIHVALFVDLMTMSIDFRVPSTSQLCVFTIVEVAVDHSPVLLHVSIELDLYRFCIPA